MRISSFRVAFCAYPVVFFLLSSGSVFAKPGDGANCAKCHDPAAGMLSVSGTTGTQLALPTFTVQPGGIVTLTLTMPSSSNGNPFPKNDSFVFAITATKAGTKNATSESMVTTGGTAGIKGIDVSHSLLFSPDSGWTLQGTGLMTGSTPKPYFYTYAGSTDYSNWQGGTLSKTFALSVGSGTPLDVYSLTLKAAGGKSNQFMDSQEILLNVIAAPAGNDSVLAASASSVSLGRMLTGHLNSQTVTISRTSGNDTTGFTATASSGGTATGLVNNGNGAITGSTSGSVSVSIADVLGANTTGNVAIKNSGNNGTGADSSAGAGKGNLQPAINIGVTGTVVANRTITAGPSPIPARVLGGSTWAVSLSGTGADTSNTMPFMNTSATLAPESGVSVKSLAGTFSSSAPTQNVVVSFAKNAVGLKNNGGLAINLASQVSPEPGIGSQTINNGVPVAFSYNTTVGKVAINPIAPTTYSGSASVATLAAGTSYADLLSVTSSGTIGGSITLGTTATLLGGTSPTGGTAGVSMDWRNRNPDELKPSKILPPGFGFLASDVLNLTTVSSGQAVTPFVLQMSYDPTLSLDGTGATAASAGHLYLGWLNGAGVWENAGLSDQQGISGISGTPFLRGWALSDGTTVGRWGVDTVNHVAWAVLDHNSEFAVVPEPSTLMLLLAAAGMAGVAWRRKQRSAT